MGEVGSSEEDEPPDAGAVMDELVLSQVRRLFGDSDADSELAVKVIPVRRSGKVACGSHHQPLHLALQGYWAEGLSDWQEPSVRLSDLLDWLGEPGRS